MCLHCIFVICTGCDLEIHVSCAGLASVPMGDFLCAGCLEVLKARRKANSGNVLRDADGIRSLKAHLPVPPRLDGETVALAERADKRFKEEVTMRREQALVELNENQRVLEQTSTGRIAKLTRDYSTQLDVVRREEGRTAQAKSVILGRSGLLGCRIRSYGKVSSLGILTDCFISNQIKRASHACIHNVESHSLSQRRWFKGDGVQGSHA